MKFSDILLLILNALGLNDVATALQADIAAGKLTFEEGLTMTELLLKHAQTYLPQDARYFALALGITSSVDAFLASAPPPAKPAPVPPSPTPGSGTGTSTEPPPAPKPSPTAGGQGPGVGSGQLAK